MVEEINNSPSLEPAIITVGSWHVHLLCQFPQDPIRVKVGSLKAAATMKLKENGFEFKRPWVKGSHMKSKDEASFLNAYNYILRHEHEGGMIYQWFVPDEDRESLNDGGAVGLE